MAVVVRMLSVVLDIVAPVWLGCTADWTGVSERRGLRQGLGAGAACALPAQQRLRLQVLLRRTEVGLARSCNLWMPAARYADLQHFPALARSGGVPVSPPVPLPAFVRNNFRYAKLIERTPGQRPRCGSSTSRRSRTVGRVGRHRRRCQVGPHLLQLRRRGRTEAMRPIGLEPTLVARDVRTRNSAASARSRSNRARFSGGFSFLEFVHHIFQQPAITCRTTAAIWPDCSAARMFPTRGESPGRASRS